MPECVADRGSITRQFDYSAGTCVSSCELPSGSELLNGEIVPLSKRFVSTISAKCEAGITEGYDELVDLLGLPAGHPKSLTDDQTCMWFLAFSQIVSNLNQAVIELVSSLLRFDWISRREDVCRAYMFFLSNLLSAHPIYAKAVIQLLISKLAHFTGPQENFNKGEMVHIMLRQVLDLVPSSLSFILSAVNEMFPRKYEDTEMQVSYLKSVFKLADYAPVLREKLFEIVMDKVIKIDLDIQVEVDTIDVEDAENCENEEDRCDQSICRNENESAGWDNSSAELEEPDIYQSKFDFGSLSVNAKETVEKLDAMLSTIFLYLEKIFTESNSSSRDSFFSSSLQTFDRIILPTYKPRYAQFLWFYMCKFDYTYYELFMGMLLTKIFNKQEPEIMRITASSYLGSFVARAQYLSTSSVRMCLRLLNNWCHTYEADACSREKPRSMVFSSVVQTIMYVFCFWWEKLLSPSDEDLGIQHIKGNNDCLMQNNYTGFPSADRGEEELDCYVEPSSSTTPVLGRFPRELYGFQRIITSKLRPLASCSTPISYEFARITYKCNIFYCYPLINEELFPHLSLSEGTNGANDSQRTGELGNPQGAGNSSSAQVDSATGASNRLEPHFPFDTTSGLTRAGVFVDSIFRTWDDTKMDGDQTSFN